MTGLMGVTPPGPSATDGEIVAINLESARRSVLSACGVPSAGEHAMQPNAIERPIAGRRMSVVAVGAGAKFQPGDDAP